MKLSASKTRSRADPTHANAMPAQPHAARLNKLPLAPAYRPSVRLSVRPSSVHPFIRPAGQLIGRPAGRAPDRTQARMDAWLAGRMERTVGETERRTERQRDGAFLPSDFHPVGGRLYPLHTHLLRTSVPTTKLNAIPDLSSGGTMVRLAAILLIAADLCSEIMRNSFLRTLFQLWIATKKLRRSRAPNSHEPNLEMLAPAV